MADHWHLLNNLRDMPERLGARLRRTLEPAQPVAPAPQHPQPPLAAIPRARDSDEPRYKATARHERHQHREQLFHNMQQLLATGMATAAIAHQLQVAPNTVRAYLARGGPPAEVSPRLPRPKLIDPFVTHLTQRWQAGARNASALWRKLKALGFRGARARVARCVRERREQPTTTIPPRCWPTNPSEVRHQ